MRTPKLLFATALAGMMSLAAPVHAAGNAENGKLAAYTCTGCHGITGYNNAYPNYHVPKIGGQNYEYLVLALKAYREGKRKHPTMNAQAGSMTDQDIEDIASYLANFNEKG